MALKRGKCNDCGEPFAKGDTRKQGLCVKCKKQNRITRKLLSKGTNTGITDDAKDIARREEIHRGRTAGFRSLPGGGSW